jgi:hypothetical protein
MRNYCSNIDLLAGSSEVLVARSFPVTRQCRNSPSPSTPSKTHLPVEAASPGTPRTTAIPASGSTPPPMPTTGELNVSENIVAWFADYAAHPERFVRKVPGPPALPAVAWINWPKEVLAPAQ